MEAFRRLSWSPVWLSVIPLQPQVSYYWVTLRLGIQRIGCSPKKLLVRASEPHLLRTMLNLYTSSVNVYFSHMLDSSLLFDLTVAMSDTPGPPPSPEGPLGAY